MKPATARDLLDLRTGKHAKGVLIHTDCGGRIAWSLMVDGAHCLSCTARWGYAWLLDVDHDKSGLYQWKPPVEVHDEFGKVR